MLQMAEEVRLWCFAAIIDTKEQRVCGEGRRGFN